MPNPNKKRIHLYLYTSLFILFITTIYQIQNKNHNDFILNPDLLQRNNNNQQQQQQQERKGRPIMYTFFELKKRKNGDLAKLENKFHQAMISAWSDLWFQAGWEPRILTMDDAKKHPLFSKYSRKIIRYDKYLFEESYNYMCFVRWLAMATQEDGGWMSDYDTFPVGQLGLSNVDGIGMNLPNYGVFTSHERWVPSLLSGSASEWKRMAIAIMDLAVDKIQFEQKKFYSDMLALQDLYLRDSSLYIQAHHVEFYPYKDRNQVDCDITKRLFGVHLSHASTRQAMGKGLIELPEGENYEYYRSIFARELFDNWKKQCVPSEFVQVYG